jgi:hypothetical protein
MFTNTEINNAKTSFYKVFTVSIISELIRQHLIQEDRDFFSNTWFKKTIASAIGFIVFNLVTSKVSKKITHGSAFRKLTNNNSMWKVATNDFMKYATQNIVKGMILMTLDGKKPNGILKSIIISMIGTFVIELFFKTDISKKELELVKETAFYKKFKLYNNTFKIGMKSVISLFASDIMDDGDIDTDALITFLITCVSIPFFFLFLKPTLIKDLNN